MFPIGTKLLAVNGGTTLLLSPQLQARVKHPLAAWWGGVAGLMQEVARG